MYCGCCLQSSLSYTMYVSLHQNSMMQTNGVCKVNFPSWEKYIYTSCNNCGDFILIGLHCFWLAFLVLDVGIHASGILILLIYDSWPVSTCTLTELSILTCVKSFSVGWLWIYKDRMLSLLSLSLFSKIHRIFTSTRKRNWRWDKGRQFGSSLYGMAHGRCL